MTPAESTNFLSNARRFAAAIPFVVDLVAMYFAMLDDETPLWAKAQIAGAIGYFVMPLDAIPDFMPPFPIGYADDAAVAGACIAIVGAHVTAKHRRQARDALAG